MPLPPCFQPMVDSLRSSVRTANIVSVGRLERNTRSYLGNISYYAVSTPEFEAAVRRVDDACRVFVGVIRAYWMSAAPGDKAVEAARAAAIAAIDNLELVLMKVKPTREAEILGMA